MPGRRANLFRRHIGVEVAHPRKGLDFLAGIVIRGLAGLLVDALDPGHFHIGLRPENLAVDAIHRVEEAVARGGFQLPRLPGDIGVET